MVINQYTLTYINTVQVKIMVSKEKIGCLLESEADTIEIALRRRMENLISAGDIESAESVESTIGSLSRIPLCD